MDLDSLGNRIVSSSTDALLVLELDGRIAWANPSACTLLGVDDLQGRHVGDYLDEAGRSHSAGHLARAAQGDLFEHEVDTMLVLADGSSRWVRLRQTGLLEDGRVTHVVLRLSDNHHDRQLLEELRASRAGQVRAERIARSGSWTWDVRTDRMSHSPGVTDIFGEHTDDLLARDRDRLLAVTHPDDHQRLLAALSGLLRAGHHDVDLEVRQRGRHGWVWVRLRAEATCDESGRLVEVSGTYQDVTRSRAAEDELQDLVTQNSLMHAVAVAANEAATLDEVLLQARDLVVLHDDWDRARAFVPAPGGAGLVPHLAEDDPDTTAVVAAREQATAEACLRRGECVWDDEQRLTIAFPVRVEEEVVAVITITSLPPLRRHELIQRMVEQSAIVLSRVAEREHARRQLADARDRALEASQHKSDFLATISHEIRTPLNGIVGLGELLAATSLSDRQRHLLSGIAVSSRSLLDLISEVLDFSKIEAGHLEVEQVDLEVREVLADVGAVLAESARSRGIELEVSCGPEVPEVLSGDPTRLKQVLLNLGSNAVKFTAEGSVSIRATAGGGSSSDADGTLLRVEVRDTGVGIDPAELGSIFAPFSQADTSTTRRYGGTGLGLAICADVVTAFGGEIGVDSEPGVGSTFWFTARLAAATGSTRDARSARAREVLGGTRVLVVDDAPGTRTILVEQLGWWGVRAREAEGPTAAAAALVAAGVEGRPYDAVLLDLAAPGRDGLPLVTALRAAADHPDLPIVLLTSAMAPAEGELRRAGVTACLIKPVPSSTLREALLAAVAGGADETPATSGSTPAGRGRVLVVEDHPINQVVARGLLEALGWTVDTADDGEDALAALAAPAGGGYDVVLMDVQMPRLDGYETTRRLRREQATTPSGRKLPVLAMTAAAVTGERERCLSAGMDDFITKPVSAAALAAALTRWAPGPSGAGSGGPGTTGPAGVEGGAEVTGGAAARRTARRIAPAGADTTHLDLDRLGELVGLGPPHDFLEQAIGSFLRHREDVLTTLARAVAEQDAPGLRAAAHGLRGSAGNIGLVAVAGLAGRIEEHAEQGVTGDSAPLLAELAGALHGGGEAITAYREWLRAHSPAG